jgi:Condensation domain
MVERILVRFEGEGSGVGELTWGQQHIFGAIQALGAPMNLCAVRPLPEGAQVDEFVDEIRFYLSRFQTMRTRLRFSPEGRPAQVVVDTGELSLDVLDVDDDVDAFVDAFAKREEDKPFDLVNDFPIRATLMRCRGALTHLVMTLSHFATDRAGGIAMYSDLLSRDPVTGRVDVPVRMHPLDLAAQQRTPAARRQSDAALAYWEELLRAIPPRRFPAPVDHGGPRYQRVELESRAMDRAVRVIADRTRVDVATVLLAIYAMGAGALTKTTPSVVQVLVSNRFRPGLADIVSNISQAGLCVVDVAGMTVDEAVVHTWRASLNAYKHAYFNLVEWKELIARIRVERGELIDLGCHYNDRPSRRPDAGNVPTPDQVRDAIALTAPPRWTNLDYFNETLMLTITDIPDMVGLMVSADTHCVSSGDMEALVREMEAVAVAAALDSTVGWSA